MPFEDDEEELEQKKSNLGKISGKKSIFDTQTASKKVTQNDFRKSVQEMEDNNFSYKTRTNDLALKFKELIEDKTLPQNKNVFLGEIEKQTLAKIASLASEIDNDENEAIGIGTLSWVVQLLKTVLYQRDRINKLEYAQISLNKKFEELALKFENMNKIKLEQVDKNKIGG